MKRFFLFVGVGIVAVSMTLNSCSSGGGDTKSQEATQEVTQEAPEAQVPENLDAMMARGKEIYDEKCIVCHMANGEGVPGAFPPLANSDYLLADKVRAVAQTLNGSNEAMVVNGITYTTPMPPQVETKEDAVAVINYVLNNFGNDGGYVTMEDVKDVVINPINVPQ